jgi:hypothetical protein
MPLSYTLYSFTWYNNLVLTAWYNDEHWQDMAADIYEQNSVTRVAPDKGHWKSPYLPR